MYQHLHCHVEDYVALVTIERPPVNALNRELVAELAQVAQDIETEVAAGNVRAVIITAAGKYFSAGADLKERMAMAEEDVAPAVKNIGHAMQRIAAISVPTIAAMQGSAFGGGFEVALAADIRFLVTGAQVGLRETALAIIPGAGGTQRLTRLIGPSNALLWIASARLFSAEEACRQGAVNQVTSATDLFARAIELAAEIAQNGPLAVRQAKKAILAGLDQDLEAGLELEFECYKNIIQTRDRIEGLTAFREKRQPVYSGK